MTVEGLIPDLQHICFTVLGRAKGKNAFAQYMIEIMLSECLDFGETFIRISSSA